MCRRDDTFSILSRIGDSKNQNWQLAVNAVAMLIKLRRAIGREIDNNETSPRKFNAPTTYLIATKMEWAISRS